MSRSQDRVFDILEALRASGRPLTLTEIAKEASIAASSAHSIVSVLVARDMATMNSDKRYSLGPGLFHLGASFVKKSPIYRAVWRDLVDLAHSAGVSAAIAIREGDHHLVLTVHDEPDGFVRLSIGSRVPLDAGSYGKAYFAYAPEELPKSLTSYTPRTKTDLDLYRKELDEVRRVGYARDDGEYVSDVVAASAVVTSPDGYEGLAAVMSSSQTMASAGLETVGERLMVLCARASSVLGDGSRERTWGEAH